MIAIIDYGLGNVQAIANVYKGLFLEAEIVAQPSGLREADKLILPGVGAFDQAMQLLDQSGLRQTVDELVMEDRVPVLGICVGMQMLANSSAEGKLPGLGWIDAAVKRFDFSASQNPEFIPHMGWNNIQPVRESPLLRELNVESRFYFLHSYYMNCRNREDVIAFTPYGIDFACAVNRDNVYGVQFHPEKSHGFGIQLLKNFGKL